MRRSKPTLNRSDLLLRVARYFYEDGKTKTWIAKKFRVSVTHIARLLDEARDSGIVRIEFRGPHREMLARRLKDKYPCLVDAVVVGTESDYLHHTKILAKAGADYFVEHVRRGHRVGLSGGLTVFELVKAIPEPLPEITLLPTAILARGDNIVRHVDPIASLMALWSKGGFREDGLFCVTITPLEKKPDGQPLSIAEIQAHIKELRGHAKVQSILQQMKTVDFVFASLRQMGLTSANKIMGATAIDLLSDVGVEEANLEGAVGDLNYSFIDENGNTRDEWRLFLSLQAEQLRELAANPSKRVVIIAGHKKERILKAALRGRLLNVLITDEITAATLLDADLIP
jgi:deoxyribonucleoside regulator